MHGSPLRCRLRGHCSAFVLLAALRLALLSGSASADWPSSPLVNVGICTESNFQNNPKITSDGSQGAIIAWSDQRNGNNDIYSARVLASGVVDPTWPAGGRALCTSVGSQSAVNLVSDGGGGALVAWQDSRNGVSDIYAHRVLTSGELDPAWPPDGLPVCTADSGQFLPEITSDGSGGAFVMWTDKRGGDFALYAQHLLGSGVVDPTWPANGLAFASGLSAPGNAVLVADGAGAAIIAWGSGGTSADLYALRVRPDGTKDPTWPASGLPICTASGTQYQPVMAPDGAGGTFVAWVDQRLGAADVYSAHILSNGVLDPTWPTDGRALCTATGDQTFVGIASSGPGQAIVTWRDHRGATSDIYAQRVHGPEGTLWPQNGLAVCVAAGDQRAPVLAADGSGGVIVAWEDGRTDFADIYAQHILTGGAADPDWPVNGAAVSTVQGSQQNPRILADGSGGAILAWHDARNGGVTDIYAQRIQANGQLGGTVVGVAPQVDADFGLHRTYPNPSNGGALRVSFSLKDGTEAFLELLDLTGRRVIILGVGSLGPGRHSAELLAGRRLQSGVYFVVLRQGYWVRSQRITVVE